MLKDVIKKIYKLKNKNKKTKKNIILINIICNERYN